jgi:superfamily II DNA or RNA helicase
VKGLFDAVRGLAPPAAWSKGVTLARAGAVSVESRDEEEIALRVFVAGSALSPRVGLFPGDREWECDCGGPLEACEHVAAAVIALRQGNEERPSPRSGGDRSPVVYRFTRSRDGLVFERGVLEGDELRPIEAPLEAIASGRLSGPRFEASPEDLEIDRALRGRYRGRLDRADVPRVFQALSRSRRITLDGETIRVSPEPAIRPVVVEDAAGGGFLVRVAERAESSETFQNGIVRVGDRLRPEVEPRLTRREWEEFSRGRIYRFEELADLVGEVLPSLKKRSPVEIRTERLPGAVRERPRLSFLLKREGDGLYVLPRVVYGDPPRARVEGDRMVSLAGEVPFRDLEGEREIEARLRRETGLTLDRGEELGTEAAIELAQKLDELADVVEGNAREEFRLHPALEARVSIEGDDFAVSFVTGARGARGARGADPYVVLRRFREGHGLVPLLEGGFAPLPADFLERYADEIEDLLAARETTGRLPKASLPDLARLAEDLDLTPPPGFDELKSLLSEEFSALPPAPVATALRDKLRDYQRTGVDWLFFLRRAGLGALLADDMGLGKTLQALAVLEGRSLVVAPTSVLSNWTDESRKFRPELRVSLYHGRARALDPGADVTITSHALLRQDLEALAAVSWDVVVIDEAQAIRNPGTELARAVYRLDARFRVSLTGTPIENRLVDLWSQFHFLNPGLLGGLSSFEERFVRPVERGAKEPLERLRERIRPFFLRRLKREVAPELPPRTETTLHAELGERERELYDAVRLAARREVVEKLHRGGSVLQALEALLRLRQAACHPSLLPGKEAPTSAKTEVLLDSLETAASEGHKSLVFSQWTSMLDLLEPRLSERGYGTVRLDGSTRDRAAAVDRFQNDPGVSVFLVSLKAGGTGLNLTAADHVFLFDPWWNPAVEEQAFDRAHRIGQDKPVFVYRLIASDTVEERILALQDEKRALAELAAGTQASTLTRDDLLRLLD